MRSRHPMDGVAPTPPRRPEVARGADDLELLSARQVADILHVHRSRVLAMMADGTLPSLQTSDRRRKIPRWALREWQARRLAPVTLPPHASARARTSAPSVTLTTPPRRGPRSRVTHLIPF